MELCLHSPIHLHGMVLVQHRYYFTFTFHILYPPLHTSNHCQNVSFSPWMFTKEYPQNYTYFVEEMHSITVHQIFLNYCPSTLALKHCNQQMYTLYLVQNGLGAQLDKKHNELCVSPYNDSNSSKINFINTSSCHALGQMACYSLIIPPPSTSFKLTSGLWCCVVLQKDTSASEGPAASTFIVKWVVMGEKAII